MKHVLAYIAKPHSDDKPRQRLFVPQWTLELVNLFTTSPSIHPPDEEDFSSGDYMVDCLFVTRTFVYLVGCANYNPEVFADNLILPSPSTPLGCHSWLIGTPYQPWIRK
ncbi:hypothetical protein EYZ11_009834 [Aspergillus tanneri]|uniref:Uncharacterized protein n=1 Tax=Aspergillus tanneri TaxID=1220188 RepID=A0A4S3J907_9EURO|nr:hypothetical protein EYZ11_009834 [Aspergillus tanneri]